MRCRICGVDCNELRVCTTCAQDYRDCDLCNVSIHLDDMYHCSTCDRTVCPDCYDSGQDYCTTCIYENPNPIQEYSSRNYPDSNPPESTVNPQYLYSGQEGEIECEGSKREVATALHREFGTRVLLKSDGSLYNGFEIVTGKLGHQESKSLWSEVAPFTVNSGGKSWKHKNTGFHVHLSRAYFSKLGLGKLLAFINSPCHRQQIVTIAGRKSPDYALLESKQVKDVNRDWGKYVAVNLQHRKSVELRIFKGTLSVNRINTYIDFTFAAAHYAQQEMSMLKVNTWKDFMVYVRDNRKAYRDLVNFLDYNNM